MEPALELIPDFADVTLLSYIRENDVEQLNTLLFSADLFLSTPGTALQHGLNPTEALSHVSGLHASYQSELIRLREIWADFSSEEIAVDELVAEWKEMKEVDKESQRELTELSDVLGSWGGGLDDVEMC